MPRLCAEVQQSLTHCLLPTSWCFVVQARIAVGEGHVCPPGTLVDHLMRLDEPSHTDGHGR